MPEATARRAISQPLADRSDRADIVTFIRNLAAAADVDVLFNQGTNAARIAAAHQAGGGRFWYATDTDILWYDDGAAWHTVGAVADGSITNAKLAADAVDSSKIVDGGIATGDIADSAITLAKTAASLPLVPIGAVLDWPWASGQIPAWTGLPVAQAISRTTYATLHGIASAAGYPYGNGDGGTTFNVPDYRARVGVGMDNMGGVAATRITVAISGVNGQTLGGVVGGEGVTLTTAQIPAHAHTHNAHSHGMSPNNDFNSPNDITDGGNTTGGHTTSAYSVGTTSVTTSEQNAGGGGAHTSMQPGLFVNKIMRLS